MSKPKGVTVDVTVDPRKAIEGIGLLEAKATGASDTLGKLGGIAGAALGGLAIASVAGAVALGAAVVSAYSEYEQLAGGVTKLFGDADTEVMQFARDAAQSAGLSTNKYLDTVTSFSASLISGLGGDQSKAAQIADMAITDMADNANTFGTSMEMLQTTYQGFAKGSFAMLDNLKLGYGGTAGEMARLINDSGVLGDAMTVTAETVKDIPFATMVEAIHQVQTGMNIAGTTAKEAAATIGGSFEATKASLQNLVLGLGDANADFGSLVGNLVTNANNLLNNVAPVIERLADAVPQVVPVLIAAVEKVIPALLPMAANLITSILSGLVQAAPALIQGAVPIVMSLVTGIVKQLPAILDAGLKILVALIQGISAALPTLIPAAISAVLGLVTALIDNLPLILEAGIQLVLGLAVGLIQAIPMLIEKLPEIIISIIEFVIGAIPMLIQAGIDLFISLVGALPEIIIAIVSAIPKIIEGVIGAVIGAIPLLIEAGIGLFVSLVENLPTIIIEIVKAVPQIIGGIVTALMNSFPKLVSVGSDLIRGLWDGIRNMGDWLWRQIRGFFGGVIDGVKALFGIHSPSTVFAGIGDNLVAGLEKGLSAPNHLGQIMGSLADQVTGGLTADIAVNARANVAAGGGAAAAGGNVTIEVNLRGVVGGAETGRAVVSALQEYVRTGGQGLRAVMSS